MTNRINTDNNQDLTIPLDDPTGENNRRGVQVSFPRDITDEEICKVLKACGWWDVLYGRQSHQPEPETECPCGNPQADLAGLCYDCTC